MNNKPFSPSGEQKKIALVNAGMDVIAVLLRCTAGLFIILVIIAFMADRDRAKRIK